MRLLALLALAGVCFARPGIDFSKSPWDDGYEPLRIVSFADLRTHALDLS